MSMTNATSPSSAAERARLYRERRSEGRHVAHVEIGPEEIEALVENCLLDPGDVADLAAVNEALGTMLYALSEGAIAVDFDKFIELLAAPIDGATRQVTREQDGPLPSGGVTPTHGYHVRYLVPNYTLTGMYFGAPPLPMTRHGKSPCQNS